MLGLTIYGNHHFRNKMRHLPYSNLYTFFLAFNFLDFRLICKVITFLLEILNLQSIENCIQAS